MEDEAPIDRNPIPETGYKPAEGAIGNWDFSPWYTFNTDFSQDWGFKNLENWQKKFQNQVPQSQWANEMQNWVVQQQQAQQQNQQAAQTKHLAQYRNPAARQY